MAKTSTSKVRVRYAETDQMGVVHHGNYAVYLELARIEWLAQYGISYKVMEEEGVMLPVYSMQLEFKKSAYFDDELVIKTTLRKKPTVRIEFDFEIHNQKGELLSIASVILVFLDTQKKRPISCPEYLLKILEY